MRTATWHVFGFFVMAFFVSGFFSLVQAQVTTFEAEDDLFTIWGRVVNDPDASGGSAIESYILGFLAFGPYTQTFSGTDKHYEATFYLKTDYVLQGEFPIGYMDVTVDGATIAKRHYYTYDFSEVSTYTPFTLRFDAPPTGSSVQFRTTTSYGRTVHIDRVEVREVSPQTEAPYIYEAENDLRIFWGSVVTDTDASAFGTVQTNVAGPAVFGPYTTDAVGSGQDHEAFFYLKLKDARSPSVAVTIDVFANGQVLASQDIHPNDFYANNAYQAFSLPFTPPATGLLEYRVISHGLDTVYIDRVEVHEQASEPPSNTIAFQYDALTDLWRFYGDPISDPDAVDNKAVSIRSNTPGTATFGPFTTDGVGTGEEYLAHFHLKIDDNVFRNWPAVYLDVYNSETEQVLGTEHLNPERFNQANVYQEFIIPFRSPDNGLLEYRMFSWGGQEVVTLDGIDVTVATSAPPRTDDFVYEAESLPRVVGKNVHDPESYNGLSVRVPQQAIGHATFGPYTSDGVGTGEDYIASFILSVADNTDSDQVALLDVSIDNVPLGSLVVSADDFTTIGEFQTFDIPFTSPTSGLLEYRVYSYGNKNFNIDAITVNTIE